MGLIGRKTRKPIQKSSGKQDDLIVVGFDGSKSSIAALRKAKDLSGHDGKVMVVHVFSVPAYIHKYSYFDELIARAESEAHEILDIARNEIGASSDRITFKIAPGKPAAMLAEFAKQRNAEMIVIGSRGLGKVRVILGSQSLRLISISPCPVMVVPDHVVI